jgi:hypothetical protein
MSDHNINKIIDALEDTQYLLASYGYLTFPDDTDNKVHVITIKFGKYENAYLECSHKTINLMMRGHLMPHCYLGEYYGVVNSMMCPDCLSLIKNNCTDYGLMYSHDKKDRHIIRKWK